jgi:hypothetical protein
VDSFRSPHEARIKLAYAANGEFVEDKIRLQNFCNAMHKIVIWQVGSTNVAVAAIKFGNFVGLDPKSQVPIRLVNGQKVELEWTCPKSQHMQEARGYVFTPDFYMGDCDSAIVLTDRTASSFGGGSGHAGIKPAESEPSPAAQDGTPATSEVKPAESEGQSKKSSSQSKPLIDLSDAPQEDINKYYFRKPYEVSLKISPNELVAKSEHCQHLEVRYMCAVASLRSSSRLQ